MKILILAAMDKELNLLLNLVNNPIEQHSEYSSYWKGELYTHDIFLAKCGIGKVNSALVTSLLLQTLDPDIVINSGVAGGAGAPIGTLLIADRVTYNDVWCGPGTIYGQADGFPIFMEPAAEILQIAEKLGLRKGLISSGDKFISNAEEITFIKSHFPDVLAVDMESASIAQTCLFFGKKFAIIRIVSDTPGEGENISQYKDFWKTAPEKTFSILSSILREI